MTKSVVVLGVTHELQGPRFIGYVDDPSYPLLLKLSMRGVDFVFEEASGLGPSIAENLANSILGPGHYVDVDPSASQRGIYRIVAIDMGDGAIDRNNSPDRYVPIAVEPHKIREELWARRTGV